MRTQVVDFVMQNFEDGSVTISPFDVLPGGCVVRDKAGDEIVVYFDILDQAVKTLV